MKNNKFYMLFSVLLLSMTVLLSSCKENPEPEPDPTPTPSVEKKISAIYDLGDNEETLLCKFFWEGDKLMKVENYDTDSYYLSYTEIYTYNGSLLSKYDDGETVATFSYSNNLLTGLNMSGDGARFDFTVTERNGDKITKLSFDLYVDEEFAKVKTDKRKANRFSQILTALKERAEKQGKGEVLYGGGTIELVYSGNNVVKEKWLQYYEDENVGETYTWEIIYTYDSKINPFQNMFMGYIDAEYFSANNALSIFFDDEDWVVQNSTTVYEYDGNYPVKLTITDMASGSPEVWKLRYEYK